jgi:hypothetical protein
MLARLRVLDDIVRRTWMRPRPAVSKISAGVTSEFPARPSTAAKVRTERPPIHIRDCSDVGRFACPSRRPPRRRSSRSADSRPRTRLSLPLGAQSRT